MRESLNDFSATLIKVLNSVSGKSLISIGEKERFVSRYDDNKSEVIIIVSGTIVRTVTLKKIN